MYWSCVKINFTYEITRSCSSPSYPQVTSVIMDICSSNIFYKWSWRVSIPVFLLHLSHSVITFRVVHDVLLIVHSFLSLNVFYYVIHYIFLIHSPTDRHFKNFHFWLWNLTILWTLQTKILCFLDKYLN